MHACAPSLSNQQIYCFFFDMSPVRIIDASYVKAPAAATTSPPPEPIKLNAMEALWVPFPLLQHVLLFDFQGQGADMPPLFDTIVESLRSSLRETLGNFVPLAGKLVHLADTGDVGIRYPSTDNDGGVMFVVAECGANISRLAGDEEHDQSLLQLLVPKVDMNELPTSMVAVQATRFEGGMALGVTVHHAVMDGRSLWTFVEAWATACRGETPATAMAPSFDRSLVKLPAGNELARSVLRRLAPNLPSAVPRSSMVQTTDIRQQFIRRTLEVRDVERLKQRIIHFGESRGAPLLSRPPSAFAAVVALAWTCFARCKTTAAFAAGDDEMLLFFLADVRDRLDPPVDPGYIGVCLTGCVARLPVAELRADHALAAAASAIQDEVRRMRQDPLARWDFRTPPPVRVPSMEQGRAMHVSGSSSFRGYQVADFGWGKPRRTENTRMNQDGQVALMRARDGQGVQLSISLLQPAHMDEFKSHFLKLQE